MLAFIAQRLAKAAVVLLAIVVLNFFLIRLAPAIAAPWIDFSPTLPEDKQAAIALVGYGCPAAGHLT